MTYKTTALGVSLNNPGNIEKGAEWQGLASVQTHARFATFEGPEWGIRAIARTLITYFDKRKANDGSKIDTTLEIAQRWAPASDNNPTYEYAQYLANKVSRALDRQVKATDTIDLYDEKTMRAVVEGIIEFENGGNPYPKHVITNGLTLAGIKPQETSVVRDTTVVATSAAASTSALAVVVESSEPITKAVEGLLPFSDSIGIVLALLTVGFTGLAVYAKLKERKQGVQRCSRKSK